MTFIRWPIVVMAFVLTGCRVESPQPQTAPVQSQIDQTSVCVYTDEQQAKLCREGQLAMFQPASFGNEQLPILAAATYCDFNYQIIHTNGAVLCVFTAKRTPN